MNFFLRLLGFVLCMTCSFSLISQENCSDGLDNDGDGWIDCYDSDCSGDCSDCPAYCLPSAGSCSPSGAGIYGQLIGTDVAYNPRGITNQDTLSFPVGTDYAIIYAYGTFGDLSNNNDEYQHNARIYVDLTNNSTSGQWMFYKAQSIQGENYVWKNEAFGNNVRNAAIGYKPNTSGYVNDMVINVSGNDVLIQLGSDVDNASNGGYNIGYVAEFYDNDLSANLVNTDNQLRSKNTFTTNSSIPLGADYALVSVLSNYTSGGTRNTLIDRHGAERYIIDLSSQEVSGIFNCVYDRSANLAATFVYKDHDITSGTVQNSAFGDIIGNSVAVEDFVEFTIASNTLSIIKQDQTGTSHAERFDDVYLIEYFERNPNAVVNSINQFEYMYQSTDGNTTTDPPSSYRDTLIIPQGVQYLSIDGGSFTDNGITTGHQNFADFYLTVNLINNTYSGVTLSVNNNTSYSSVTFSNVPLGNIPSSHVSYLETNGSDNIVSGEANDLPILSKTGNQLFLDFNNPAIQNSAHTVFSVQQIGRLTDAFTERISIIESSNCSSIDIEFEFCNAGSDDVQINVPVSLYNSNPTILGANVLSTNNSNTIIEAGKCVLDTIQFNASVNNSFDSIFVVFNDSGQIPTPFTYNQLDSAAVSYPECDFSNNITAIVNPNNLCQEDCSNGVDDDGDGLVDCDDPDCYLAANSGDIDTDNDGIGNNCDLDNDNDGILDSNECTILPNVGFPDFTGETFGADGLIITNLTSNFNAISYDVEFIDWDSDAYLNIDASTSNNAANDLTNVNDFIKGQGQINYELYFNNINTWNDQLFIVMGGLHSSLPMTITAYDNSGNVIDLSATSILGTFIDVNGGTTTWNGSTGQFSTPGGGASGRGALINLSNLFIKQLRFQYSAGGTNDGFYLGLGGVSFCDSDSDNTPNYLDSDSDEDNCSDVLEAGHTDGDSDGYLGTSPVTVDSTGLVLGQGGYTGNLPPVTDNLTLSCPQQEDCTNGSDDDGDGLIDCDDPDCALSLDCYTCDAVGLDGADTTWQFVTPEMGYNKAIAYRYTGFDQSITIPNGVTEIDIKVWGAAGGNGVSGIPPGGSIDRSGGAGGFAEGNMPVTGGSQLLLVVGEGGIGAPTTQSTSPISTFGGGGSGGNDPSNSSGYQHGASGGGLSGVFSSNFIQSDALMIAGGGGGSSYGGGTAENGTSNGGGLTGDKGPDDRGVTGGGGGTQLAGGMAGTGGNSTIEPTNGAVLQGGNGGSVSGVAPNLHAGGGGGGGYFGGGGGDAGQSSFNNQDGGGGGGSGYLSSLITNGVITKSFTRGVPPENNNVQYLGNTGFADQVSFIQGGHGLIVIQFRDTSITEICGNGCDDDGDGFIDNNDLDCNDCTTLCDTTTNKRFEVTPGDATIVNYIWTVNNGAVITSGQGTTAITVDFTGVTVGNLVNLCVSYTDNNGCTSDPFCDQITIEDCCVPLPAPASIECD